MDDQETQLYYLQSRYYNPEIGRFINADALVSTGQGLLGNNMFAYCLNNPVNYIDVQGNTAEALQWWTAGMAWLPFVDSVLPIGDFIYGVGIVALGICALNEADTVTIPQTSYEEKIYNASEKGDVTAGDPPTEKDGYRAPKGGPKKGKTKDGKTGWVDKNGNIWVPAPTGSPNAHGGGHWDVQRGDGKGYSNVYPGGRIRPGGGKLPELPPIRIYK